MMENKKRAFDDLQLEEAENFLLEFSGISFSKSKLSLFMDYLT